MGTQMEWLASGLQCTSVSNGCEGFSHFGSEAAGGAFGGWSTRNGFAIGGGAEMTDPRSEFRCKKVAAAWEMVSRCVHILQCKFIEKKTWTNDANDDR